MLRINLQRRNLARFAVIFLIIFNSLNAKARVCPNIFPPDIFLENSREGLQAQQWAKESLDLAQQLAQTDKKSTDFWLRWKISSLHHKVAKLFPLPAHHPGPLFLLRYFYPEAFWTTTIIVVNRRGALRTRTPYIDEWQRQSFEYQWTEQGLLHVQSGKLVRETLRGDMVIGLDQKIYLAHNTNQLPPHFRHSSFFAGMPVLFAGVMEVQPDGTVSLLSNKSGHYFPSAKHLRWAYLYLRSLGFKISETALNDILAPS